MFGAAPLKSTQPIYLFLAAPMAVDEVRFAVRAANTQWVTNTEFVCPFDFLGTDNSGGISTARNPLVLTGLEDELSVALLVVNADRSMEFIFSQAEIVD